MTKDLKKQPLLNEKKDIKKIKKNSEMKKKNDKLNILEILKQDPFFLLF